MDDPFMDVGLRCCESQCHHVIIYHERAGVIITDKHQYLGTSS